MAARYLIPVDVQSGCSRRHAIKIIAAVAGGTILGRRTRADVPWGEPEQAACLNSATSPLALGERLPYETQVVQADPTLAMEGSGERLWTTWTRLADGSEGVWLRSFSIREQAWDAMVPVGNAEPSGSGLACNSDTVFVSDRLVVVWLEYRAGRWALLARSLDPSTGEFADVHRLAEAGDQTEVFANPAVASDGRRALVVWQARHPGRQTIGVHARMVGPDGAPAGEVFDISAAGAGDCCRPAVAAAPDGSGFAVAFDRQDAPGTQNIYLVKVDGQTGAAGDAIAVSNHPATDLAPALAYSPDSEFLWVAWHSNRRGDDGWDIPRWCRVAALRLGDHTWHQPVGAAGTSHLDDRGTLQGFELVRLAVSPNGVVCVLGRASQNFYVQYYSSEGQSPLYRLPKDGWGGRGRLLRGAFGADGALWVTRRDLQANALERIDGFGALEGPPPMEPYGEPTRGGPRMLVGIQPHYEWPPPRAAGRKSGADSMAEAEPLQVYFGDIHGHSWQSDGVGEPEEAYLRARDVLGDDFHVLTDHDRFVGRRITDGQWQQQKDVADHYHAPGKFVTLFGQEWTTPRINRPHGWGHFIVYTADPRIPLLDHGDPRYRDLPDLYAAVQAHRAIAIPHHIGWTGVPWDALDTELTPAVEICSVHGAYEYLGNEPIRHRGGLNGCFVRDGLARGLRFGLVGGSDQHGLIWHHGVCWKRNVYRAGLTGVWAAELTREAILDAMRNRRTFATTGVKLRIHFAVNSRIMGSIVETEAAPEISVEVAIPPEEGQLGWLQIVRDGVVIHQYGGEGQRSRYSFVDQQCPRSSTSSYYLRVTLADRNQAWSSPIWVTRA